MDRIQRTVNDYTPEGGIGNIAGAVAGGFLGNRAANSGFRRIFGDAGPWQGHLAANAAGGLGGALMGGTQWGRANTLGRIPGLNRIPGMPNINRYNAEQAAIQQQRLNEDNARSYYSGLNATDRATHANAARAGDPMATDSKARMARYNQWFNSPEGQALRARGYSEEDMGHKWQTMQVQNALYNRDAAEIERVMLDPNASEDTMPAADLARFDQATQLVDSPQGVQMAQQGRVQPVGYNATSMRPQSTYNILQTLDPTTYNPAAQKSYAPYVNPQTGTINSTADLRAMPAQAGADYFDDSVAWADNPANFQEPIQAQPQQSFFNGSANPMNWGWGNLFGGGGTTG
jgi:hypothetical protein